MRSRMKLAFLHFLRATGLFALVRRLTSHRVRILCYHGAWDGSDRFAGDALFITPQRVRQHLDLIETGGYTVVSLDTALEGLAGRCQLPAASVAITIDDGWYSSYLHLWPELRKRGMPATLYVDSGSMLSGKPVPHVMARYLLEEYNQDVEEYRGALDRATPKPGGGTLVERMEAATQVVEALGLTLSELHASRRFEYMTADELRTAANQGLDVQLHTRGHLLVDLTSEEVETEVLLNRSDLAEVLGRPHGEFRHFCYPSGVHHPDMYEGIRRAGVESATTITLGLADRSSNPLALPRLVIGEMHSDIEFEAELCGVMDLLRSLRRRRTHSGEGSTRADPPALGPGREKAAARRWTSPPWASVPSKGRLRGR